MYCNAEAILAKLINNGFLIICLAKNCDATCVGFFHEKLFIVIILRLFCFSTLYRVLYSKLFHIIFQETVNVIQCFGINTLHSV